MEFGVWCGVWGLGFGAWGLGFRVWGLVLEGRLMILHLGLELVALTWAVRCLGLRTVEGMGRRVAKQKQATKP